MKSKWVFLIVLAIGLLGLGRTFSYYGTLYHGWDAQFYYSLAHSILFDQDIDVTNNLTATPAPRPFDPAGDGSWSGAPRRADGGIPSKYPIGLSLVEVPFLAVGNTIRRAAEAAGVEVRGAAGYSAIELWSVAVGLLSLTAAGLTVLYRLVADEYGRVWAAVGVVGCWFGTSLFYYSAVFPFMAHATSFAILALILHATRGLTTDGATNRRAAVLGLLFGALFLVRPQQVVAAFFLLPFIVSAARSRPASQWLPGACLGAAAGLGAVAAQQAFNRAQFGTATVSGYAAGGEGFSWLAPQFDFVLFNPDRGLIVFSPVLVVAVFGYVAYARSVPGYVWPAVGNAIAQVYLIAAWSSPEQGDSFGTRMWSDNAAVVAVGVALALYRTRSAGRWALLAVTLVAIGWSNYLLARYVGLIR